MVSDFVQTERVRDGGTDQCGITDGSERDKTHPVSERLQHVSAKSLGQPSLADARGPGQCEQPDLRAQQQVSRCLSLPLAPKYKNHYFELIPFAGARLCHSSNDD
jgi:hypothetical protein